MARRVVITSVGILADMTRRLVAYPTEFKFMTNLG